MIDSLFQLARPALYSLDPENAHNLVLKGLAFMPACAPVRDSRLGRRLFGIDFPNPVGLAAGFDKNGVVCDGLLGLGFGFVELGTVTPRPQNGNPRPRLFRLDREQAIINRLGFNNFGAEALLERLEQRRGRPGIVGVNLGANRDSQNRIADYETGVRLFAGKADYLTINISSPNTPGLRDLQQAESLGELLEAAIAARGSPATPILVKLAPDLDQLALEAIAELLLSKGIDGAIVSNTTLSRPDVSGNPLASEQGGLSGRPLFHLATIQLARFRKLVGPDFPLVGVGGIDNGAAALDKLAAGADLIQVYSGMIFQGPGLIRRIVRDISARLDVTGEDSVAALSSAATDRWAALEI